MKIAFVSQPFAHVGRAHEDSITIWTHRVLQAINRAEDAIIIYCRTLPEFKQVEQRGRVEYRRVPANRDEKFARVGKIIDRLLHHPRPKRPFFASPFNYLEYGLRVALDLRQQCCDIVHIHNSTQFVPLIRVFNPHIKIVLHMHCEWLSQLDQKMIEQRLAQTDLIIGCSKHVIEKIQTRFPQFAERCQVVHNGVDLERFSTPPKSVTANTRQPKRLLYVGRVSPEKGVHVLLSAMEKVCAQFPDIQLDVVGGFGSAPFEYMVLVSDENMVRDLGVFYHGWRHSSSYTDHLQKELPVHLRQHINFVGELPHDAVIAYYHQADVLVNPALSEAFGLSLVEAMASKLPVVATNVGGMQEIVVHNKTGLLVEPTNPDALANALIDLLQNENLCHTMGENGYGRVTELYTWQHIADTLWSKYHWVLNRHAAASLTKLAAQSTTEPSIPGKVQ